MPTEVHDSGAYDVFVSYVRDPDFALVRVVKRFLEGIHRLGGVTPRLRRLRVFVDGIDLVSPAAERGGRAVVPTDEVWNDLAAHLKRARRLLLLCSEHTPQSQWVDKELEWFLNDPDRGVDAIWVVVTGGSDPAEHPEQVFSQRMMAAGLHHQPWFDFRGYARPAWYSWRRFSARDTRGWKIHTDFVEERVRLAAKLNGAPPNPSEVWHAWTSRRRRRRYTRVSTATALVAACIAAYVYYHWAQSRKLAAQSLRTIDSGCKVRLARRAYGAWPTVEAETALRRALLATIAGDPVTLGERMDDAWPIGPGNFLIATGDSNVQVWSTQAWLPDGQVLPNAGRLFGAAVGADTRILTASGKTATLWVNDGSGWNKRTSLGPSETLLTSAALSRDGRVVMTATGGRVVRLWDSETGRCLVQFCAAANSGVVEHAAFSPDGRWLVTAGSDAVAHVWDVSTGAELLALLHDQRKRSPTSVSFDPSAALVATAQAHDAYVWRVGAALARGHEAAENPLRVAECRCQGTADRHAPLTWTFTDASHALAFTHSADVKTVRFSPDGSRVVTASNDTASIWNVVWNASFDETPGAGRTLAHPGAVLTAFFRADDELITVAQPHGQARVWHLTGPTDQRVIDHHHEVTVLLLKQSGSVTAVVTGSEDGRAKLMRDVATGATRDLVRSMNPLAAAAFSRDGTRVLTASGEGTPQVWDVRNGASVGERLRHTEPVTHVAFDCHDDWVAIAGDSRVRVWRLTPRQPVGEPIAAPEREEIVAIDFTCDPDSLVLVTTATVQRWNLQEDGHWEAMQPARTQHASHAWFSCDRGAVLLSGDADATVLTAHTLQPLGPAIQERGLALSCDGTLVATAHDGTARVWNVATRTLVGRPLALPSSSTITSAAFSPDGKLLATGAEDGTLLVWEIRSGRSVRPSPHTARVNVLTFSADGLFLGSASNDGQARVIPRDLFAPIDELLPQSDDRISTMTPRALQRCEG